MIKTFLGKRQFEKKKTSVNNSGGIFVSNVTFPQLLNTLCCSQNLNNLSAVSYPFSRTSTDFILRVIKSGTQYCRCSSAVELVRFIEWMLMETYANGICREFGMSQVTREIAFIVINVVLKRITCDGANVYEIVQQQKEVRILSLWIIKLLNKLTEKW